MDFVSSRLAQWHVAVRHAMQPGEVRRRFTHVRRAQTVVAATVSVLVAVVVARSLATSREARSMWSGEISAVAVREHVARGEQLTGDNTIEVMLPPALVPQTFIPRLREGMRAGIDLPARTVLTTSMLDERVALPESWRIVAFSLNGATPPLTPGDSVDIVSGTSVLVDGAVVASLSPLTVAVPPDLAPLVAAAVRLGDVSLVGR